MGELEKREESSPIEKNYEFPEGQVIAIGVERFYCSEVLFESSMIGMEVAVIVNKTLKRRKDDTKMVSYKMWISKGNYDKSGPSIVHRKCF
ncbi:actin-like [Solanum tuberosum]|uniref:actin-like n=1 Tax=Solanum tuberosum TaxID=4113 RepID=UPI00073A31E8|nr:PREDICTED: actin-like [Solanum tuberosum]